MLIIRRTGLRLVAVRSLVAAGQASFPSKRAFQNRFSGARVCDETIVGGLAMTSRVFRSKWHHNDRQENIFIRIQTVDVWESKFQSIPLCAVDARNSILQSGSSLPKDGVHEAQSSM